MKIIKIRLVNDQNNTDKTIKKKLSNIMKIIKKKSGKRHEFTTRITKIKYYSIKRNTMRNIKKNAWLRRKSI